MMVNTTVWEVALIESFGGFRGWKERRNDGKEKWRGGKCVHRDELIGEVGLGRQHLSTVSCFHLKDRILYHFNS
jgi:hypothetical protein